MRTGIERIVRVSLLRLVPPALALCLSVLCAVTIVALLGRDHRRVAGLAIV